MTNLEVANTILAQLGGRKFTSMTGAKHLIAIDSGLQLKLPNNFARNGINTLRIVLDPSDTYTVEFGRSAHRKGVHTYTVKAKHEDVYCDQLRELFEDVTGLATCL